MRYRASWLLVLGYLSTERIFLPSIKEIFAKSHIPLKVAIRKKKRNVKNLSPTQAFSEAGIT